MAAPSFPPTVLHPPPPAPAAPAKRRAPMRVGVEGRAKEDPVHRVRHEAAFVEAALDRLLLLQRRRAEDSGRVHGEEQAKDEEASALEAATAALGIELTPEDLEERRVKVAGWRRRLAELLADPGVPQRTPAWYEARKTMVTASDVATALGCGKFGTQRTFFQKKCGAPEEQAAFDATLPPLKWGVMYEPVAQAIYSAANQGVFVHEFGLLRHPTLPFVGASPDGITELGVMLEIKCPWRRKIAEGEVPLQYYYQIQAQLAVCGLDECDFFEVELFEVEGPYDDAWDDRRVEREYERGVLVEWQKRPAAEGQPPEPPTYAYPPRVAGGSRDDLEAWVEGERAKADGSRSVMREHWWVLRRRSTSRVMFDPAFSDDMFKRLAAVWGRTIEYRGDRDRYLDEVGAAAPPAPPSEGGGGASAQADAEAVERFSVATAGYAFVDE
jgi:putative phage-type endonuclease